MTSLRRAVGSVLPATRPTLRVQLTLLYSGMFLALIGIALFAAGDLYQTSRARAPLPGSAAGAGIQAGTATRQFQIGPFGVGLLAALVGVLGAWWIAGRILRPLRAITTTAQEISSTNLHQRLNLSGPDDELTTLGRTLDQLLGRLETAFDAQRHFVANASHELRTPLAGQRTLLQVALADPDATAGALRGACEEALRLGAQQERLIDGLLSLATGERGVEHWEPVDLADIARKVLLDRHDEALGRGIHIDTSLAPAPVAGDPHLLASLVANLVDNAILHNDAGGTVHLATTDAGAGGTRLSVSNAGPLVRTDDIHRLFQPFQQARTERTHTSGHGLGLAIVNAIVHAHDATLVARPGEEGGLLIVLTFPRRVGDARRDRSSSTGR